jgi:hypothetical protein
MNPPYDSTLSRWIELLLRRLKSLIQVSHCPLVPASDLQHGTAHSLRRTILHPRLVRSISRRLIGQQREEGRGRSRIPSLQTAQHPLGVILGESFFERGFGRGERRRRGQPRHTHRLPTPILQKIVRRSAVVQSRIWKFTASFPEWDANRVVLERQAFYVRWARRPRKERASTVIARVRGELGGGLFICLKIRRGAWNFQRVRGGGRAQMVEIERGSENFEGWSGGGACVLIVLASRSASHLFKRHADSLRSLVRHCLLEG